MDPAATRLPFPARPPSTLCFLLRFPLPLLSPVLSLGSRGPTTQRRCKHSRRILRESPLTIFLGSGALLRAAPLLSLQACSLSALRRARLVPRDNPCWVLGEMNNRKDLVGSR